MAGSWSLQGQSKPIRPSATGLQKWRTTPFGTWLSSSNRAGSANRESIHSASAERARLGAVNGGSHRLMLLWYSGPLDRSPGSGLTTSTAERKTRSEENTYEIQ